MLIGTSALNRIYCLLLICYFLSKIPSRLFVTIFSVLERLHRNNPKNYDLFVRHVMSLQMETIYYRY